MALNAGERLGPYEIVEMIGKGGMGEVYRARDPRLDRDVAIKVSNARFSERFEREARAVAALNHPNIAQIYDVASAPSGFGYLVMEFVEGEAPEGPYPLEEALRIARQIADALGEAHEKGIVHRDLKPANIRVKSDGVVKVLDFGLAKFDTAYASAPPSENSPTLSMAATQMGVVLGTAAYMSPEQARGKPTDKRADIWAFGVVLHELLTGRQVFKGEDISHTMAQVITLDPKLDDVPFEVQKLLHACLEKDPKKRLRDIGDVWKLLEKLPAREGEPVIQGSAAASGSRLGMAAWAVAGISLAAFAALAFLHFREPVPDHPQVRSTLLPPQNTAFDFNQGTGLLAVSPDGRKIVFGAHGSDGKSSLWVRSLDALTAQALAGTDGALWPFWSPDSRSIAFFADGKLKKIDAAGGAVITLTDVPLGRGGSWNQDGVIIFGSNPEVEIRRVSSAGGASSPIGTEKGRFPSFLPDGRHYLFEDEQSNLVRIYVGSLDGAPAKELKTLGNPSTNAMFAQGRLLYMREGTLMAQPFDPKRLETTGEAVPVAEQVERVLNSASAGSFSVSQTGLLAFHSGPLRGTAGGLQLTWFDRQGKPSPTGMEQVTAGDPRLSPDGSQVAYTRQDDRSPSAQGGTDIWLYEFPRGTNTRFTSDPALDFYGIWSPDGTSIAFGSTRSGNNGDLYQRASNAATPETLVLKSDQAKAPTDWSGDGRFLMFEVRTAASVGLWYLPMQNAAGSKAAEPKPYLQSGSREARGRFSPDGRFVAYQSDESGKFEVYIRTFPDPDGGRWTVSKGGGSDPVWGKSGKELFYLALDANDRNSLNNSLTTVGPRDLMAVDVAAAATGLKVGAPKKLFTFPAGVPQYSTVDGQRFLKFVVPTAVNSGDGATPPQSAPLTLVLNWMPSGK